MKFRLLAMLVFASVGLAGCASAPAPDDVQQAMRTCDTQHDGAVCRRLAILLVTDQVPRPLTADAEESVLKACWSDRLVDPQRRTDARYRLCYEVGRHFSARATNAMEAPDTGFRKVAAHLYLRACQLGQPQGCRLLLSECLLLDDDLCSAPPSEEQAQSWASERRERDARAREQ